MARSIPTTEPSAIVAGDSLQWDRTDLHADYPASTWTLRYTLAGPASITFDAAEGSDGRFEVREDSTTTALLPAGTYRLRAHLLLGGDRFTNWPDGTPICDRRVTVVADPETSSPGATHAETMLGLVEAALEGRIPEGLESYTFDGVAIAKIPVEQLHRLRAKYAAEVQAERAGGLKFGSVRVRF